MKSAHFSHPVSDGKSIYVRLWLPEGEPKALILMAHGMAEHGARYERFAQVLAKAGYALFMPDHRGHGKTAETPEELGYFADAQGFRRVIDDLHEVGEDARKRYPGRPLFLFGHSLGSLLSQGYISVYGEGLAGCALSGTSGPLAPALATAGKTVAAFGCRFKGRRALGKLADKMSFGAFNDAFKPNRTAFDWLSRDEAEVDKYIDDPYCGFVCRYGFFLDLLEGLTEYQSPAAQRRIPKDLPILMAAGAMDPVGGASGSVTALAATYRRIGIKDVEDRLYPEARHEILNETNRDEVMADFLAWFERQYAAVAPAK